MAFGSLEHWTLGPLNLCLTLVGDRGAGTWGHWGMGTWGHRDMGALGRWGRRRQGSRQGNTTIDSCYFLVDRGPAEIQFNGNKFRGPCLKLLKNVISSPTPRVEHKRACATCQEGQQPHGSRSSDLKSHAQASQMPMFKRTPARVKASVCKGACV